jgi:transporter family protein
MTQSWQFWAVLSATFAALTVIFAKIGVSGLPSDHMTLLRTVVVLAVLGAIVAATGQWQNPAAVPGEVLGAIVLSGLATEASWLCYFGALKLCDAARVAPIDKLSVVMVAIFTAIFLGERLSAANWAGVGLIGLGAVLAALKL